MKLSIVFVGLFFTNSVFAWSVVGVSCFTNNYSDQNKITITEILPYGSDGQAKLDQTTITKSDDGSSSQSNPGDKYEEHGLYSVVTKINPTDNPISDWLLGSSSQFDGYNFEHGILTNVNGVAQQSKVIITFVPFTDKAYGPDNAKVEVYSRSNNLAAWVLQESMLSCSVIVEH